MGLFKDLVSIDGYDAFILLLFLILVLVIIRYFYKIKELKYRTMLGRDENLSTKKLNMQLERMRLEALKDAAIVLNEEEREKLDALEMEKSILSRKDIYLENEIEGRLQRLELARDLIERTRTLKKIKGLEEQLLLDEADEQTRTGFFRAKKKNSRIKADGERET